MKTTLLKKNEIYSLKEFKEKIEKIREIGKRLHDFNHREKKCETLRI